MIQDQNIIVLIIKLKNLDLINIALEITAKKHACPLPDGLQQTFHLKINKVIHVWQ